MKRPGIHTRPIWRRRLLAAAILLGVGGSAAASTLEQTIQYTIDTHPDILEAAANRHAVDEELEQAKGLYRPQIDFTAETGPEWVHRDRTDGWEDPEWTNRYFASITETVYDKFRSTENDRQRARVNAAALRVMERIEVVALNVTQSYLDVLRHNELVRLAEENVTRHMENLDKVQQRLSGGQSGIGDLQQAEARLANAKATLAQAKRDLDEAEIAFHSTVGRYPKELLRPRFNDTLLPPNVQAAVDIAIDNSPTVALTAADLDVAQVEIDQSDARFHPTVEAQVVHTYNENTNGVLGVRRDTVALLALNYNLYRGGIDTHAKREAIRRRDEARERYRAVVRTIEEETRMSWTAIARTSQRLAALEAEELANSQVVSTYRQEFDIGQRSLLNLLDSENELFNAQVNRVTAEYAEQYAKYRLLASMGSLADAMALQVPDSTDTFERQTDFEWVDLSNEAAREMLLSDAREEYSGNTSLTAETFTLPEPEPVRSRSEEAAAAPQIDVPAEAVYDTGTADPFAAPPTGNPAPRSAPARPSSQNEDPFLAPQAAPPRQSEPKPQARPPKRTEPMMAKAPAESTTPSQWLVMLPPFEGYDAASGAVSDLQANGFDAYVLLNGRYRHAVSTGLFSVEENAYRLAERLERAGFDAQVVPWSK